MARLLVASVVLVCALCQSAFGVMLRGEVKSPTLIGAPSWGIPAGTEVTVTFAVDTTWPYIPEDPWGNLVLLRGPNSIAALTPLSIGNGKFYAGDGIGADMRARVSIPTSVPYNDPSVVLTPAMLPTITFIYSYLGPSTNYQWADFTILQDAPITWHYVPEPASYVLGLLALGALLMRVRRK